MVFYEYRKKHLKVGMIVGQVKRWCGNIETAYHYKERAIDAPFKSMVFEEFNPCSGTVMYTKWLVDKCPYNEAIRRFEDLDCLYRKYHHSQLVLMPHTASIVNTAFSAASRGRKDINEDFLGHLNLKGKGFWETLALQGFPPRACAV